MYSFIVSALNLPLYNLTTLVANTELQPLISHNYCNLSPNKTAHDWDVKP
jgi:hypothetical protein